MNKLRSLVANGIVAALDFCAGAFIAAAILHLYDIEPLWAPFIGGLMCLLPDLDVPCQFKSDSTESDHHRSWLHCPLLVIGICAIVSALIGGVPWAIISTLALIAHYIHDTSGPYGGVMVAWPISKNYWSFVNGWEDARNESRREIYIRVKNHADWISRYWQRPSILSLPELGIATGLTVMVWWLDPGASFSLFLAVMVAGAWAGLMFCTVTRPRSS